MSEHKSHEHPDDPLRAVMTEVMNQAAVCRVRIDDPAVIEAVLRNDEAGAASTNALAFRKMREALMMAFVMRGQAFEQFDAGEAARLASEIRAAVTAHVANLGIKAPR